MTPRSTSRICGRCLQGRRVDVVIDRLSVREGIDSRLAEAVELAYQLSDGVVELREQEGTRTGSRKATRASKATPRFRRSAPAVFVQHAARRLPDAATGSGERAGSPRSWRSLTRASPCGGAPSTAWGKPNLAYYRSMLEKIGDAGWTWTRLSRSSRRSSDAFALEGGAGFEGILAGPRAARTGVRAPQACRGRRRRARARVPRRGAWSVRANGDLPGVRRVASESERALGSHRRPAISEVSALDAESLLRDWLDQVRVLRATRSGGPAIWCNRSAIALRSSSKWGSGTSASTAAQRRISAGEAQRVHLATQLGARLSGVLYVLDEPTAGLHPADAARLLATLDELRDIGNTLVVVEHDEQTMRAPIISSRWGRAPASSGGTWSPRASSRRSWRTSSR